MDLKSSFDQAVEESTHLAQKPSNDTLLQLYSLYKQATEGDISIDPPAPFDFVAKAKFDAWSALAGKTREVAMKDYIALMEKLSG
jgi:acyl-CoA-binding protein